MLPYVSNTCGLRCAAYEKVFDLSFCPQGGPIAYIVVITTSRDLHRKLRTEIAVFYVWSGYSRRNHNNI